jgi:hypothetical protein
VIVHVNDLTGRTDESVRHMPQVVASCIDRHDGEGFIILRMGQGVAGKRYTQPRRLDRFPPLRLDCIPFLVAALRTGLRAIVKVVYERWGARRSLGALRPSNLSPLWRSEDWQLIHLTVKGFAFGH